MSQTYKAAKVTDAVLAQCSVSSTRLPDAVDLSFLQVKKYVKYDYMVVVNFKISETLELPLLLPHDLP